MQRYFKNINAINRFLESINTLVCPVCGACGAFVRHGFVRGSVSASEYGIRGWRIYCDPDSPHGAGCGWSPSIWLNSTLLYRCFSAEQLCNFIQALLSGRSVYSSWKHALSFMSLRTGYRLFHRLKECQSILRTQLLSRSPPPEKESAGSPLLQMFRHLQEAFGAKFVSELQQKNQRNFLSTS
jgi:hypothetical protein